MTSSDSQPSGSAEDPSGDPQDPKASGAKAAASEQAYADHAFRSGAAMTGGVLLLALALWLGGDAVIRGEGRTPWLALAGLLLAVPLVVAFTLRPAVYANETRLRVRNPFRTITMPWATVESLTAAYSSEVVAEGQKYQMWAIPVSLRARKKAARGTGRPSRREVSIRTCGCRPPRRRGPCGRLRIRRWRICGSCRR